MCLFFQIKRENLCIVQFFLQNGNLKTNRMIINDENEELR